MNKKNIYKLYTDFKKAKNIKTKVVKTLDKDHHRFKELIFKEMELPIKKSILAIFAGIVISGTIVTSLVIFGVNIQDNFEFQILLGLILLSGLLYWYFKKRK